MNKHIFPSLSAFDFSIEHHTLYQHNHVFEIDSHIHDCCEIYVNLSGNISFMVENNIYPVKHGEAIITRPHEYHHCIYHSNAAHEFFWILFSSRGNEKILLPFFDRPFGEGNLISPTLDNREHLIKLCDSFSKKQLSEIEKQGLFWQLIGILDQTQPLKSSSAQLSTSDFSDILQFIDAHLCEPINIRELAQMFHLSLHTLERFFDRELNMTPLKFIQKKRLNLASAYLRQGVSVQQAGMNAGFSDISYFIKIFKKTYGLTPFQYKKQYIQAIE